MQRSPLSVRCGPRFSWRDAGRLPVGGPVKAEPSRVGTALSRVTRRCSFAETTAKVIGGVPAFRMNLSDIEGTYGAGCRIHAGEGWALYVRGKNPLPAPAPELARGDSISGCRLTLTGMRGQLGIGGKPYDIPLSAPIPLSRAYQTQAVTTTVSGLAEARHFSGLSDDRGGRQQRDSGQALEGPPSPSASLAATSGPAPPGPLPAPSVSARKIRIL